MFAKLFVRCVASSALCVILMTTSSVHVVKQTDALQIKRRMKRSAFGTAFGTLALSHGVGAAKPATKAVTRGPPIDATLTLNEVWDRLYREDIDLGQALGWFVASREMKESRKRQEPTGMEPAEEAGYENFADIMMTGQGARVEDERQPLMESVA